MRELAVWLQASPLGTLMRDAGPWTYAFVNLAHIFGIAALFGAILILDLRLIGAWRRTPLAAIAAVASPVAACGLALAATTGAGLLATRATEYVGNPFLYVKLPVIAVGVANAILLRRSGAWRALGSRDLSLGERRQLAWMGGTSLVCWLTAIAAGRLIAYW
ncbi:MAG: hypothetical protein ABI868_02220 [Acidobacteriota bacterium]